MVDRVALVLGTSAGGVGRHVRMLAEGLAERGATVLVAGPRATDESFGFSATGAHFAEVPISDRPRPASDLHAVARLRLILRNAQAVHAHGLRAGALAALALAGRKRPGLVVTLHNAPTAGGAIGAVYGVLERIVAARAARVLVVSPDLGERMRSRGARSVETAIVPAPPLPPPRRDPEEVRAEFGAAALVVVVARLAQQKGLNTLLDAASGLHEALVLVAGDGPLRAELRDRIVAEKLPVRLLGYREDVSDLLAVADVVVLPSLWEGQPLVVQEALRAGKPLVATAVGGVPDLVGDAGLLVPPADPHALRRAAERLLHEPELAAGLAKAARERARTLPNEQDALAEAERIYDEIAQEWRL